MKRKTKTTFDPATLPALLPDELARQVDHDGRPIRVGDRVDDCNDHLSGIVVSVFGDQCIFLTDTDGILGVGRFANQTCENVWVLPPVADLEQAVADVLARRKRFDESGFDGGKYAPDYIYKGPRNKTFVGSKRTPTGLTYIDGDRAKDANGRLVRPGDTVAPTEEGIGAGFDVRGIVVGVAGGWLLVQDTSFAGKTMYDSRAACRVTVLKQEVRRGK